MNIKTLRVALLFEVLACMASGAYSTRLHEWATISRQEIDRSPDAILSVEHLFVGWAMSSGISIGMALCIVITAFGQRSTLLSESPWVKLQWLAVILPMFVIFWIAKGL